MDAVLDRLPLHIPHAFTRIEDVPGAAAVLAIVATSQGGSQISHLFEFADPRLRKSLEAVVAFVNGAPCQPHGQDSINWISSFLLAGTLDIDAYHWLSALVRTKSAKQSEGAPHAMSGGIIGKESMAGVRTRSALSPLKRLRKSLSTAATCDGPSSPNVVTTPVESLSDKVLQLKSYWSASRDHDCSKFPLTTISGILKPLDSDHGHLRSILQQLASVAQQSLQKRAGLSQSSHPLTEAQRLWLRRQPSFSGDDSARFDELARHFPISSDNNARLASVVAELCQDVAPLAKAAFQRQNV